MKLPRVLLTGDYQHHEFRDSVCWLKESADVTICPTIDLSVWSLHQTAVAPFATVVAQSRPGQFSSRDVERLHSAAPLARIVAMLGSWCESETRTGHPWPGVPRVYWHEWIARCSREFHLHVTGQRTSWDLPRTATLEERVLHGAIPRQTYSNGLIAICTPLLSVYESLNNACSTAGYTTQWVCGPFGPRHDGTVAVIWDGTTDRAGLSELASVVARAKPIPVIAVLGFPRGVDLEISISAGASMVLAKPFQLSDLLFPLDQMSGRGRSTASPAA